MNKHIFYYLMVGSMALLLGACNDSMNDLLEPKVYFEARNIISRWKMKWM